MSVAISVKALGKSYLVGHQGPRERYVALRDVLARNAKAFLRSARDMLRGRQIVIGDEVEEFWALRNVSFEVRQGDVLGIIGRNGAGKSTLLKILSRITEPTEGRIELRGRVSSLLEVGTGFHPELTGRENVYLNGAILGMTREEIRRKFDAIVAFAEVENFLDTPVKRYSSGMYVRLAFAVAAHLDPQILIVDEVLAVGDAEFQKRCLGKMKEVSKKEGRTVLFVSHNMNAVQSLCSQAMLLKTGKLACVGEPHEVVKQYLTTAGNANVEQAWDLESAPGTDKVKLMRIRALSFDEQGLETQFFVMDKPVAIDLEIEVLKSHHFHITLHLLFDFSTIAFTSAVTRAPGWKLQPPAGRLKTRCEIPANLLNQGNYSINVLVVENGTIVATTIPEVISFDVHESKPRKVGECQFREPGVVAPQIQWTI